MKTLFVALALAVYTSASAEDIRLPAKLVSYDEFVVAMLKRGVERSESEDQIRVRIAWGWEDTVDVDSVFVLPRGSTVVDAAAAWEKDRGKVKMLLGWPQGLVLIRRKIDSQVQLVSWLQRQARTEAPKFQLLDGDVIIGLVFSDL